MPMSDDERRRLRELEGQLDQQHELTRLARQLSAANVYTGLRRITWLWATGGALGLILIVAGALAGANAAIGTGVGVLVATLLVSGVAAIVVEVRGYRRAHKP